MTDKEKIRAEIDRLLDVIAEAKADTPERLIMASSQVKVLLDLKKFIDSLFEEPVSEDLDVAANDFAFKRFADDKMAVKRRCVRIGYRAGANWQKGHLWHDAQSDDLPDYDREVVAFQTITNDELIEMEGLLRVVIAHRPNPKGWDGKSLTTGKVEHYTPKTYDKGGWNMEGVTYWLDAPLPEGIE